jgi:hypothetical protein
MTKKSIPITFKCTTYGRVHLLEETLMSFLQQEYDGEYEMLIVNDCPFQHLVFEHPKVRIINLKETFKHIGEKEDYAIAQCKYGTIAVTDDDDVYMPNHLQNINKYFPSHELLDWNNSAFMNGGHVTAIRNIGNSGIVFSKKGWKMAGGYPHGDAGADMDFVRNIEKAGGKVARVMPPDNEVSAFYRWGENNYNLSGMGRDTDDRENIVARHSAHVQKLREQGKVPEGIIKLNPHWKKDYSQMLKDFIATKTSINPKNLGGWAIEKSVLDWLLNNIPKGSTVLEFGAGSGTIELAKFYDVISVEHNPNFCNLTDRAKYVLSPLEYGWYRHDLIDKAVVDKEIKAVIIDGPPGAGNRSGVLNYIHRLRKASIIIDDTNRAPEAELSRSISSMVGRKNFRITGNEKSFDII